MAKWVVTVPYEGTAYIPVESDEKPVPLSDPVVANRMHTGYMSMGLPRFFRNEAKVEPADDDYYKHTEGLAKMEFSKKPTYQPSRLASTLDSIADALEAKGFVKEAAEVDAISNAIDKAAFECGHCGGIGGHRPGCPMAAKRWGQGQAQGFECEHCGGINRHRPGCPLGKPGQSVYGQGKTLQAAEQPEPSVKQKIESLKQPANIIEAIKAIARKIPKQLMDDLLDALSRDIPASGMREAGKKEHA